MSLLRRWLNWLPWTYVVRHVARAHGFIDPVAVLSRLHRFAQPSEVGQPVELLRAGVVFHARGLLNTQAIQHNLDWVWPYWVVRQFDPGDESFLPRAFSITHVNLTHRNWTAIGLPGEPELPIVDPRGLLTPFWDSWSVDVWLLGADGTALVPSRRTEGFQRMDPDVHPAVSTLCSNEAGRLEQSASVAAEDERTACVLRVRASSASRARLVVSVRPYNPEGVSFIHRIEEQEGGRSWLIDEGDTLEFATPYDECAFSNYKSGDVFDQLVDSKAPLEKRTGVSCDVGMGTGAAVYEVHPGEAREVTVKIPLQRRRSALTAERPAVSEWSEEMAAASSLEIPDPRMAALYRIALQSLILHSPGDVYPGPYTYRRFWFRDAAFLIDALLSVGLQHRAIDVVERYPERQTGAGYFLSQDGEWDSNGEAIWTIWRYREVADRVLTPRLVEAVRKGVAWFQQKRTSPDGAAPHAGLLPAGFSAEHLGPNDHYYWDDFWAIAGLRAGAALLEEYGFAREAVRCLEEAEDYNRAIERSLSFNEAFRETGAVPASPYRRLDAGAVGSLAASYPLRIWAPDDARMKATADFLVRRCFFEGAFFQDMIHSGLNAYLTLHVAQALLRARDPRYMSLIERVAELASPTGQWPEAIHPRTLGGCMGDGHHVWASAEWLLIMRSLFVQEEADRLVLLAGIPSSWVAPMNVLRFGPAPTRYGTMTVALQWQGETPVAQFDVQWRRNPVAVEFALPGSQALLLPAGTLASGSHLLQLRWAT